MGRLIFSLLILELSATFSLAQRPSTAWQLLEREVADHPGMTGEFVRPAFFLLQGFDRQADPTPGALSHLSFGLCADSSLWRFGVSGVQYNDPDVINARAQISIAKSWKLGRWQIFSFGISPSLNHTFLPQDESGSMPEEDIRQTFPNLSMGIFYGIRHTRIHLTFRNAFDNSDKLAVNDQPSVIAKLGHTYYLNRFWNFTGMVQYHKNLISDLEILEFGLKIRRKQGTCLGLAYSSRGDWSVYLKPRFGNHVYPFFQYDSRKEQSSIVSVGVGVLLKDPNDEKQWSKIGKLGFLEKVFQEEILVVFPPHGIIKKQQHRQDRSLHKRSWRKKMRTKSKALD